MTGQLVALHVPAPDDDLYDRLAKRHRLVLTDTRRVDAYLAAIQSRFLDGELVATSGARKGKPHTRTGRRLLWGRIHSLVLQQARLMEERSWIEGIVTGNKGDAGVSQ